MNGYTTQLLLESRLIFTFCATEMEEEGADEDIPIELSVRHV